MPDFSKIITPVAIDGLVQIQAQLGDIAKDIAKIILGPHLVNLSANLPKVGVPESLQGILRQLADKFPPNWPVDDIDLIENVFDVIQDDGIPLVWVPRKEIVTEVLKAPNRDERIKALLARRGDVIQDCRAILATISHPDLANQLPLAKSSVDAFEGGHDEAAQALAVVITETVVSRAIDKKYAKVRDAVKIEDWGNLSISELRLKSALAAVGPFYVTWFPNTGTPAPTELSRHVTVHQADASHYTPGNAIVAVMLVTSVLRAIQELREQP